MGGGNCPRRFGQTLGKIRANAWDFSGKTIITVTFSGKLPVCPAKMNRSHTPMIIIKTVLTSNAFKCDQDLF